MLCVKKQWQYDLREGMKFEVRGAGTDRVNGTYTCLRPGSLKKDDADLLTKKEAIRISWSPGFMSSWPDGWYMEDLSCSCRGIYFLPSGKPDVIPLDEWEVYNADMSNP